MKTLFLALIIAAIIAGCSQNENQVSNTNNPVITPGDGSGKTRYTAVLTQYNSDPSFISGTVTDLKQDAANGSLTGSNQAVNFNGLIGQKIRDVTPIGGTGAITLTGTISIAALGGYTNQFYFQFHGLGNDPYTYIVHVHNGVLEGSWPASATMTFDNQLFAIERAPYHGSQRIVLWGYTNTPNGTSFDVTTSQQ